MKKFSLGLMIVLLLAFVAGCASDGGEKETTANQKITFGVTPWTSTVPPTKIASLIIQDMGYDVEEISADATNVYIGLSRGDIDVFMDSWLPAHENLLEKYADQVEDTAISYDDVETGLVVPTYMEDINSVNDLKGKEDLFSNEVYGIESGANVTGIINELLESYELDLKQVNSSEGGMLAQARRLMENEDPVSFFGWRPHTMFNQYDLKVLADEQNFFETAAVHVITNNELKENAPDVHQFLSNWHISLDEVEEMIVKIEDENADPEAVAREWIDNNQDKVNEMIGK
ncbi:glycine betaine ABC transporter substrate-binding protein [Sporosarcina pasteurii]|uniref:Glycine betaine-binding protein n=1 Tax=Sporosarcina pasteurii TaxID=1474 RepID=A0A380BVQ3_SPOPA|nr:glycine betaine ABC transporter substrate-binding protein [Sporosarcina pasteurii]MDS9471348.1 glycine betaine ABC transporter substrate-binding protein [Sporosarcina pasteurii]SUJ07915.1 Glycine betaine-binding protein precursor [Sporosarcina pasteurii]